MSGLSNHSQQTNDGCAQRTQRRILNTDGNVMAKLCAPYTISVLWCYMCLMYWRLLALPFQLLFKHCFANVCVVLCMCKSVLPQVL